MNAALAHVEEGSILGVGTGSTVDHFIDAMAAQKLRIRGAVSSSERSTKRLLAAGFDVLDLGVRTEGLQRQFLSLVHQRESRVVIHAGSVGRRLRRV